jgi:alpha-L-fucosidase
MNYLVFTTKHHDGFCMFDTKLTDYRITSPECPFHRDIVAELSQACHESGLPLGFYYSPPDWHHPDYRTAQHSKYIAYLHGQLRELCSRYGKVDIIWFDGLGGTAEDWNSPPLFKMIRHLQPHVLINNRAGMEGDYDTPEQQIGTYQTDRPWESCITICKQWAWKPDDELKSLKECIQTIVQCAGGDGNLLLNVGPMPNGKIEPRQVERLREIGSWLSKNGESIYGTRGGPVPPQSWGVTTRKKNVVYVHVLSENTRNIGLPAMNTVMRKVSLLDGTPVEYSSTKTGTVVKLPESGKDSIDTIIKIEYAGEPKL